MAAFEKYKRSQAGYLCGHSRHEYEPRDGHIDFSLSHNNTVYVSRGMDYLQQRLLDLECSKRSDINVLAELIVTKPKTFLGRSDDFFDCIFEFAKLNYKEQNIVYAIVHRDEPTAEEHIHIGIVPTTYDSKKKKATVSYDKCIHRKLDKFHPKLSEYCEKRFGYDIGIINGATKDGNKSIDQLKAETQAREEQERLRMENERLRRQNEALAQERENLLTIDDKLIVAKYKEENERLKRQNRTYFEFVKQNKLVQKFKNWFEMVTGKSAQKQTENFVKNTNYEK